MMILLSATSDSSSSLVLYYSANVQSVYELRAMKAAELRNMMRERKMMTFEDVSWKHAWFTVCVAHTLSHPIAVCAVVPQCDSSIVPSRPGAAGAGE